MPRYVCVVGPGRPGCGRLSVVAEPLDELIERAVVSRLSTKAMTRFRARKAKGVANGDADLVRIERDVEGLAADFGAGRISRREWLAARKPLGERLAKARRILDAANGTAALEPFQGASIRATWERLDVDRKRAVVTALIDRVTINPAAGPIFSPDRIDVTWRV